MAFTKRPLGSRLTAVFPNRNTALAERQTSPCQVGKNRTKNPGRSQRINFDARYRYLENIHTRALV